MKLKYIGEDGQMGLEHGKEYKCVIHTTGRYIKVSWENGNKFAGNWNKPYPSLKAVCREWEDV